MTITDSDLAPGAPCPVCGEQIVTWSVGDNEITNWCTIPAEDVVYQGPGGGFDGEYINIDHDGPSLDE